MRSSGVHIPEAAPIPHPVAVQFNQSHVKWAPGFGQASLPWKVA